MIETRKLEFWVSKILVYKKNSKKCVQKEKSTKNAFKSKRMEKSHEGTDTF